MKEHLFFRGINKEIDTFVKICRTIVIAKKFQCAILYTRKVKKGNYG